MKLRRIVVALCVMYTCIDLSLPNVAALRTPLFVVGIGALMGFSLWAWILPKVK